MIRLPDAIKDVYEHEEQGDQQRHPARHHLRLDEEAHPTGHHEHEARQINLTYFNLNYASFIMVGGGCFNLH